MFTILFLLLGTICTQWYAQTLQVPFAHLCLCSPALDPRGLSTHNLVPLAWNAFNSLSQRGHSVVEKYYTELKNLISSVSGYQNSPIVQVHLHIHTHMCTGMHTYSPFMVVTTIKAKRGYSPRHKIIFKG